MIAIGLTKEFGVLASDSAAWSQDQKKMVYEHPKISVVEDRYLLSYVGSNLYFTNFDLTRIVASFNKTALYLEEYLKDMKPRVDHIIEESKIEKRQDFALVILGVQNSRPLCAVFMEKFDFVPRYNWSVNENRIIFVPDVQVEEEKKKPGPKPKKKEKISARQFVEELAIKNPPDSPGLMGELLTKGIYRSVNGSKEKEIGGVVNAAFVDKIGRIAPLSIWEVLKYGYRKPAIS